MSLTAYDLKSSDIRIPANYVDRERTLPVGTIQMLDGSKASSITDFYNFKIADISTADTEHQPVHYAGNIVSIRSVIYGTIATADADLTCSINGVAVTGGVVTVTASGSAAGDTDVATPTAANTVAAGDYISVATDGASTNTIECTVVVAVQRNA